jgi:hypothetical protein
VRSIQFKENSFEEAKKLHLLEQFECDGDIEEEIKERTNEFDDFIDDYSLEEEKQSAVEVLPDDEKKTAVIESTTTEIKKLKGYSDTTRPITIGKEAWKHHPIASIDERNVVTGSRTRRQVSKDGSVIDSSIIDKMPILEEKIPVKWDPEKWTIKSDDGEDNANLAVDDDGAPLTFEEAISGDNAQRWWSSMRDEMASQMATGSFVLVKRTKEMNVLPSKWVYKVKRDENGKPTKEKSRLVPKGFRQRYGIDYDQTFAPTARQSTWRTVLARAVEKKMRIKQGDVPTAFLKGELHHEIYMQQPDGFVEYGPNGEEMVWRLQRPIYGIKQAPREWYHELRKYLTQTLGMNQCSSEPCVYVRRARSGKMIIFLIWVDDIWACCEESDEKECDILLELISKKYGIKEWHDATSIIGIRINYDRNGGVMKIDQEVHANDLLKRMGMEDARNAGAPTVDKNLTAATEDEAVNEEIRERYLAGVGGLLWQSTQTKPGLSFSVGVLARFMKNPQTRHAKALDNVLRYLRGTVDMGLTYRRGKQNVCKVTAYCDSDWAEDQMDRKSTSGYLVHVNGNLVLWGSKKQTTVSLSSSEAEYKAMSAVLEEIMWLTQFLQEIGEEVELPSICYCDNNGAKLMGESEVGTKRTKHIDIRHHFIKDEVEKGTFKVKWISTTDQLADLLTKCLGKFRFTALLKRVLSNGDSD